MAGCKFKTIKCPFCEKVAAHITYEENRVYQLNCPACHNAIFHQDRSWDAAVRFFETLLIVEEGVAENVKDWMPVVHGAWIDGRPFVNSRWKVCSVCHDTAPEPHGGYDYCPNCGAKMDLEVE